MADLAQCQAKLTVRFRDESLLQQALVHRSFLNENPGFPLPDNERLEFLGDAVLGLVAAEELYRRYPDLPEGELTKLRSALVKGDSLAYLARRLGLGDYLYLGRGEEHSGGRRRPSNLARAYEAVVGAVFLDRGWGAARRFVKRSWADSWEQLVESGEVGDYKSLLQEEVQTRQAPPPHYEVVEVSGPDHAREFTVEVSVAGRVLGKGRGSSKQAAEKEAARVALESRDVWEHQSTHPR